MTVKCERAVPILQNRFIARSFWRKSLAGNSAANEAKSRLNSLDFSIASSTLLLHHPTHPPSLQTPSLSFRRLLFAIVLGLGLLSTPTGLRATDEVR